MLPCDPGVVTSLYTGLNWFAHGDIHTVHVTDHVLFSPQCNQLIEQYEPLLVQLLLQTLDPDFVCMVRW